MAELQKSQLMHIKGGKPAYGVVEISGDVYAAILIIADFIASKRTELQLTNVPRCQLMLDFLDFIVNIGVQVKWLTVNQINLKIDSGVNTELNFLEHQYPYLNLVIPALFQREKEISISIETANIIREQIKFYVSLGIKRNVYNGRVNLIAPLDTESTSVTLRADADEDIYKVAGKLLLKKLFPNIRVTYNEHNPNLALLLNGSTSVRQDCPLSLLEFNFFAALGILTDGDIEFANFDLTRYLNFLLKLVDVGANYEIIDNRLKLWYEKKDLSNIYVYPHIALDELGYLILITSLLSEKNVRISTPPKDELDLLGKELNIIKCRNDHYPAKDKSGYVEIMIKPSRIGLVRNNFRVSEFTGINLPILVSSFINDGRSWVSGIDYVDYFSQNLRDNLMNLNLDITLE